MKILCKIFGHPDRPHYHRKDDVVPCNGGCEKHEKVYEISTCPRCGAWEKDITESEVAQELKSLLDYDPPTFIS